MASVDVKLDDRPQLAPAVRAVLGTLRRRIRQYVWLEGAAAAVAWLGVAFWATLAIDWFFEPPAAVRAAMIVVIVAVFAGIVLQLIGRRAFVRMTDSNMATVLERRFRTFDDSLLTAVVLGGRAADGVEFNPEMLAQTCREAAARIGDVRLRKVFNPQPLWRNCMAAVLLVFSVLLFRAMFPEAFGIWASRALAFSNELWPRTAKLSVDGFADDVRVRKVARGSDVEIVARAATNMPQVPQLVEVRYRTDGGARGRASMDRRGIARVPEDPYQEYTYTFRSVLGDVHFDVVGGDDRVSGLTILVVDSPTLSASKMTLHCKLPPYIGHTQPPLPVTAVMQVPMGTKVTVHADDAANKELVRVQVDTIIEDKPGRVKVLEAADLAEDRRGFRHTLAPLSKDTTLLFTLTDSDGIKSRDPVRLALVPIADQPPQLAVQLDGIGTAITPQARLPAVGRIADDYGIGRVWFEHVIDQQKPQYHPLALPVERPTELPLTDAALEIRELGVTPGQKLLVCVKAADLCDIEKGPNVGSSERWLLDVVTPEQLRAMLEARELVLRQRFERIVQEMTETRDLLARLDFDASAGKGKPKSATPKAAGGGTARGAEPGDEEPANSPERQRALRTLRVQGGLSNSRKSTQEVLGVADAFDDIRKQLVNNRIDTEELKNRLQAGIAEPLRKIAGQMFPEFERRLEKLQAVIDDAQLGPAQRDSAQQQADAILLAMRKVLDRMIELEDFNEAVELLRTIIKSQEQLQQQTQERQKQKIRELLKE